MAQKTPYAERTKTSIGAETAGLKGDQLDAALFKIQNEERTVEAKTTRAIAEFACRSCSPPTPQARRHVPGQ